MQGEPTKLIGAQVSRRLYEEVAAAARAHDRSVSAEIREALRLHLRVHGPQLPSGRERPQ